MFSRLFKKSAPKSELSAELNPRVIAHYGIPSTASRLAYDPIQHILAIGTSDGKIKVIGNDNIEALLMSFNALAYKFLEFLQNQGFVVGISVENDVQVWDLELRCIASSLQWKSNITAFSIIYGTGYMYIGDEYGSVSVLQFNADDRTLLQLPYQISSNSVSEAAEFPLRNNLPIVGVLTQPCSSGHRVLFVYENGIIVLWDITEDQLVLTRGHMELRLKEKSVDGPENTPERNHKDETSDDEQVDKEISSICWACLDGSILAVGYIDGDIMLWNLRSVETTKDPKAEKSAPKVHKLQFSSAQTRIPVIFLNWTPSKLTNNDGGRLFVYGGAEIGAAEVLTIVTLEWTSSKGELRGVSRVDLTLNGPFADMILLRNLEMTGNDGVSSLFVLTSPGQLQLYDDSCLSALSSRQENVSILPLQYSSILPTTDPHLTTGKLCSIHAHAECSRALLEMTAAARYPTTQQESVRSNKWQLTGGLPSVLSYSGEKKVKRIYIAGYHDGSVKIWDASYPVLSHLFTLDSEIKGIEISGSRAPVSALDFSPSNLAVAVGNESGLVRLFILKKSPNEAGVLYVTNAGKTVHALDQGIVPYCSAAFASCSSSVTTIRYTDLEDRLLLGYENGKVAMLDMSSLSVLFLVETLSGQSSPIVAFSWGTLPNEITANFGSKITESGTGNDTPRDVVLVFRKDSELCVLDITTGNVLSSQPVHTQKDSIAVSMHVLEESRDGSVGNLEAPSSSRNIEVQSAEVEPESSLKKAHYMKSLTDVPIVFSFTNGLLSCTLKSLIQQDSSSSPRWVDLGKSCCWSSICYKDGKECGMILFYESGVIEIRSLPELEVVGESSLASVLRWNVSTNLDKTMSSTMNGQIALVNGCEFAIMSIFAFENDFRIPESLPGLHDKALESFDFDLSPKHPQEKEGKSGIISGLIKGLRSSKETPTSDPKEALKVEVSTLKRVFWRLSEDAPATTDDSNVIMLNIDDIEIDQPWKASKKGKKNKNTSNRTERANLLGGEASNTKPKPRTIEEIKAMYKKPGQGDAAGAAAAAMEAKNKLLERQEKLERLTKNTEELQNGAEDFASMAQQIAKKMETRKWWQL